MAGQPDTLSAAPDAGYDLVLERDGRSFVFRVRPGQEVEVLERLSVMADDPDDPLTWYEAALLTDRLGAALGHRLGDIRRRALAHPSSATPADHG